MPGIFSLFSRPAPVTSGPPEWIIVGLGNVGGKYDGTRHNIGFEALDALARDMKVSVDRLRFRAVCGEGVLSGKKVLLMKPTTLMNLSGQAVREAAAFYKLPMDHVLVLCDDINLPVGRLRIRLKGSDGGHNGLKNIIYLSGSDDFPRVRMGVGQKPHPDYDLAAWVLGKFSTEDIKTLSGLLGGIPEICGLIVAGKAQEAMGKYN